MNKLNAEQIKMALECCISAGDCTFCPLRDVQSCPGVLEENTLALICKYEKLIEDARSKSKTSDIAREIFEEIDKILYLYYFAPDYTVGNMIYDLNELKKKYTEDENDEV